MNKIIPVNTTCFINDENPTPSKKQDIAISITAVNPEISKFKNFVLSIENFQKCCENFGTEFSPNINPLIPEYITHIEINAVTNESNSLFKIKGIKELLNLHKTRLQSQITINVYNKDNILATAKVYNHHNGYYSHLIETIENNTISIDYI